MNPLLDQTFFGRENELKKLIVNILIGKHTLIIGKKGIGKTKLLNEALSIIKGEKKRIDTSPTVLAKEFKDTRIYKLLNESWKGKTPIKIITADLLDTKSQTLQKIILQIYNYKDIENPDQLFEFESPAWETEQTNQKIQLVKLKLKAIPQLSEIILNSIAGKNYRIIIDNIDSITPQLFNFFTDLIHTAPLIATATELKHENKLKSFWSIFDKIELKELDKKTSEKMSEYLIETYIPKEINQSTKEFLKNEIIRTSKGNPLLMKSLIAKAHSEKIVSRDDIKEIRKHEESEWLNLGPFFALALGVTTLLKILQIGLENREAYILLSAFSFLAYLTIRIFRYFFLFRPQRKK